MHKNRINAAYLLLLLLPMLFQACSGSDRYKQTDSGLKYKIYVSHDSAKPAEKDILLVTVIYRLVFENGKDSVLFDKRNTPFPIELIRPEYPGDIYEGLAMLGSGDSATFILNPDSFYLKTAHRPEVPTFITPGSRLHFDVKVKVIKKRADYEKEQREVMDRQMKVMAEQRDKEQQALLAYISENRITTQPTATGLYYIETRHGRGPKAVTGRKVKVDFTGTLLDGTEFDSSKKHGQPFEFVLGDDRVIAGWNEGISMMRAGGKAKLIIPSVLGYGGNDRGVIPPYSPLVFEVELLEVN